MKYRLKMPLPFMAAGKVFKKGCWVGGGWGVDRGTPKGGAHRGVETFSDAENEILTNVMNREDWTECIPESVLDLFILLDAGLIDRVEFNKWVKFSR